MKDSMVTSEVTERDRPIYPFTAIVSQTEFKTALILNAIDPRIGGVLLTGPKGTGKSTIVRAVAEIFPEIDVVKDCIFGCSPFDPTKMCEECGSHFARNDALPKRKKKVRVVSLPLSATEDRVVGSLDVETALTKGVKAFQPGILVEANQNILYIDEVNLLPDHITDMILDVCASGWNVVEREGISVAHPSSFILVGSMNPEEGGLRPQIIDRFGLHSKAQLLLDPKERIEVIWRGEEFLKDPLAFRRKYEPQQEALRRKIQASRERLFRVQIPLSIMEEVTRICTTLQVDGHRPDLVMARAAKAIAAFNNRETVLLEDVFVVSNLALSHRTRKSGLEAPPTPEEIYEVTEMAPVGQLVSISEVSAEQMMNMKIMLMERPEAVLMPDDTEISREKEVDVRRGIKVFEDLFQPITPTERLKKKGEPRDRVRRGKSFRVGKHVPVVTSLSRGRYAWHETPKEKPWNIALVPTIRVAAPYQKARKVPNLSVVIKPQDIRTKMREYDAAFSIVVLVDLSQSVAYSTSGLHKAIAILRESLHRRRDRVGIVVFKGDDALVLQEPTTNLDLALTKLMKARASDYTPLAAGMLKAWKILRLERQRNKDSILMLMIATDGKANVPLKRPLSNRSRRKGYTDSQADALDVARRLARDNIRTVVVNTYPLPLQEDAPERDFPLPQNFVTPTEFLKELARVSKGIYLEE